MSNVTKIIIIFALLGAVLGLIFVGRLKTETTPTGAFLSREAPVVMPQKEDNESQVQIESGILPETLNIPKLGISTNVESVGLDGEGKMDVPKNTQNVAWYNLGYQPGEVGNAVLSGHFDTVNGAPAIFYNLNSLNVGDKIVVLDKKGEEKRFIVTGKRVYDFDKFPLEEVFGGSSKSRLNLITCDGVFNQNTKNYSQRLVIYSELIS